ncbi:hypothetical protein [Myxococcus sp. AS-1-15]|uniref:hypothetical protein n=1 Tax=Myxococcus sp. AS-1-15 TaxID=2874600 RepID=UPI001CBD46B0|nr:hypothetical protein [Myxococcus sp. AS-1-15]MBZ4397553.1 hypothetical protein [Myxococcus sp. AS-1-15]
MKSPRNTHRPYTVEISAGAWSQVARLSQERYRAIQAHLERVASLGAQTEASATFQVDELHVHYAVDARRRLVTLVDITRDTAGVMKAAGRSTAPKAPGL